MDTITVFTAGVTCGSCVPVLFVEQIEINKLPDEHENIRYRYNFFSLDVGEIKISYK
jgi:hypothetical protein